VNRWEPPALIGVDGNINGAALAGAGLAYVFYVLKPGLPEKLATKAHAMYSIMLNKYTWTISTTR